MAKKLYCVRRGRIPGIYHTWDECKKQVMGFGGAEYKSFENESDALEYMNLTEKEKKVCDAVAYTDGSYDIKTKRFSAGAVLFWNESIIEFKEAYSDSEMAKMRNVAGEIMASKNIMEYCAEHGIKSVEIIYDYAGVEKWCTGEWKTNKEGTREYKKYYDSVCNKISVVFTKVKGHSGNKYNDMADRLAKEALGIV